MPNTQTDLSQRFDTANAIQGKEKIEEGQDEGNGKGGWLRGVAGLFGLGELYDDVREYFTGEKAQEREWLYNLATMDEQNRFTKEMWEAENEYNSTANQLKRWMEAGGNPNAFFGGEGTNTGNASSVTSGSGGNVGSTIGMLQGGVNGAVNAAKGFWETQKVKAEAEGKQMENGRYNEITDLNIMQGMAQIELWKKQGAYTEEQANQIKELLPFLKGKSEQEIKLLEEQTNKLIEETNYVIENTKYVKENTRYLAQQTLKEQWKNLFREQFNVDPDAGHWAMLIEALVGGKGDKIMEGLYKTTFTLLSGGLIDWMEPAAETGEASGKKLKKNITRWATSMIKNHPAYTLGKMTKKVKR